MKRALYLAGRACQLIGLIAMPSAIWIAEMDRSEQGAIAVFAASGLVFFIGYLFVGFAKRS